MNRAVCGTRGAEWPARPVTRMQCCSPLRVIALSPAGMVDRLLEVDQDQRCVCWQGIHSAIAREGYSTETIVNPLAGAVGRIFRAAFRHRYCLGQSPAAYPQGFAPCAEESAAAHGVDQAISGSLQSGVENRADRALPSPSRSSTAAKAPKSCSPSKTRAASIIRASSSGYGW